MSQQELLSRVTRALDDLGIDYMVTGSIASSLQGEPRLTHDIDLVVALTPADADRLIAAFPESEFYLSAQAVREAIDQRRMFNLLHFESGDKVDFWLLKDHPFDISRFARKRQETVLGNVLKVSRPEDTILAKLRWAKQSGGSDKQFTDVLRVYEIQFPLLDMTYLDDWANRLDVVDLWARVKSEATPI
jgi:hypothetical protein